MHNNNVYNYSTSYHSGDEHGTLRLLWGNPEEPDLLGWIASRREWVEVELTVVSATYGTSTADVSVSDFETDSILGYHAICCLLTSELRSHKTDYEDIERILNILGDTYLTGMIKNN